MSELRSVDAELFAALTSSGPITFWLTPAKIRGRIYNKVARFHAVDPAYLAWGPRGILAFVISIHFDEQYTPRFLRVPVETPASQVACKQAAMEWLSDRGYPAELIEPFRVECFTLGDAPELLLAHCTCTDGCKCVLVAIA
jgi:hypothetical protein